MGESKDINVKTSAFDLTIHWNPAVVGSQACIFIGLLAIAFFAGKGGVRNGCIILIIVDVLTLFIGLLGKSVSFDDEETAESDNKNTSQQNAQTSDSVDVEVSHDKGKKSSVKQSKKTIKNKVKMPNGVSPRPAPQVNTAQQSAESTPTEEIPKPTTEAEPTRNDPIQIDLDELDPDLFDLL